MSQGLLDIPLMLTSESTRTSAGAETTRQQETLLMPLPLVTALLQHADAGVHTSRLPCE